MKELDMTVARAQKGDAAAFEQLVVTYRDQVFRLALRMCGNETDADEAAQDAFLSAWKGLPNFRGDSRFSTWLYQLTTHAAIDLLRRQKRRGETDDITEIVYKNIQALFAAADNRRAVCKRRDRGRLSVIYLIYR